MIACGHMSASDCDTSLDTFRGYQTLLHLSNDTTCIIQLDEVWNSNKAPIKTWQRPYNSNDTTRTIQLEQNRLDNRIPQMYQPISTKRLPHRIMFKTSSKTYLWPFDKLLNLGNLLKLIFFFQLHLRMGRSPADMWRFGVLKWLPVTGKCIECNSFN